MSLSPYRSRIKNLALTLLLIAAIGLAAQAQTPAPQGTTPQSPELAEASKVAVQVAELCHKGQYDAALPLARHVVEIRDHALGADHPRVGDAVQNLAAVQFGRKNYGEAESLYKRALKVYEKAYGPDSVKLDTGARQTRMVSRIQWQPAFG